MLEALISIAVAVVTVAAICGLLWLETWLRPPQKRERADA